MGRVIKISTSPTISAGGTYHGWTPRTVIFLAFAVAPPIATAAESHPDPTNELLLKLGIALGSILIAQAIIPVVKAWLNKRSLRATYRTFLQAHVENTLESFTGAGSTHFAENHLVSNSDADWFIFLKENDLGVPQIFIDVTAVIDKARSNSSYIPSVNYFGLDGNQLDSSSPIWEINGAESQAAVKYFLTQKQIETSIDYQYDGWYFDLIKSTEPESRERWCKGMENVLFDMAQHYKAATDLQKALRS